MNLINFLKSKGIEFFALIISLINLYLYCKMMWKEKVKFIINQDNDEAYSFSFAMYEKYNCMFFHISIDNKSKTDTSISKIELADSNNKLYAPTKYDVPDCYNENGISLFHTNEEGHYTNFNLKTENLLNNLRVPSYGNVKGYLVFFDIPVLKFKEKFILKVYTPSKVFKKEIIVNPLPNRLRPQYP